TVTSSPRSSSYRPRKLDASANAPWTSTTVGELLGDMRTPFPGQIATRECASPVPEVGAVAGARHEPHGLPSCLPTRWTVRPRLARRKDAQGTLPDGCGAANRYSIP